MIEIGYWLSSEEHAPSDLVRNARRAEEVGVTFAMISDHFHPWIDRQGHGPFVWAVLGGIAQATTRLRLGTGVTCPTIRIHPAIIAQAAATVAAMLPDRFFLGVGTGENLNEHILGDHWPPVAVRQEMLEEALTVIGQLWQGGLQSHRGRYYTVENARLYTLPDTPPPIMVAASGAEAATLPGRLGDGLIGTTPEKSVVERFDATGGASKPRYAQLTLCWVADEASARRTAHEIWPTSGLKGELSTELPLSQHFERAAQLVTEDMIAETVPCGPDPEPYLTAIRSYADAGFDHVALHQIGPDQEGFFRFYEREIQPRLHER